MTAVAFLAIVYVVVLLFLAGTGFALGYLIGWIVPGVETGMGYLIGILLAALTLHFQIRLMAAMRDVEDESLLEDSREVFAILQPPQRKRKKRS